MVHWCGEGYILFGCGIEYRWDELLRDSFVEFAVSEDVGIEGFGRMIGLDVGCIWMFTLEGLIVVVLGRVGGLKVLIWGWCDCNYVWVIIWANGIPAEVFEKKGVGGRGKIVLSCVVNCAGRDWCIFGGRGLGRRRIIYSRIRGICNLSWSIRGWLYGLQCCRSG